MRLLLANRNARLYILGQSLSSLGDSALWLALGIWIKMLTGSASAAGLSFFMFTLGGLGGPLGGLLADRVRRRPLLIVVNLATAALVLFLLLVGGRQQVWLIYAVMFGYGLSAAVLGPAQSALLQTVIPEELLGEANSVMQTLREGMRLITPLLGAGLLTAFGPTPVIVADAVTFLIAVAALLAMQVHEERPKPSGQRLIAEAVAGARHIRRTAVLRQVTLAAGLAIVAFGLAETAVFAVVGQGLHRPDGFIGVVVSTQGVGAIVAGLTATALMRRLGEGRLVALGLANATLGFLLLATSSTAAALAGAAFVGSSLPLITVGLMTLFQRRTPPELMGRTDAALGLVLSTPQTIAIALGAALISVVDYRILLLGVAGLVLLASGYLFTRAELRSPDRALAASAAAPACSRDTPAAAPSQSTSKPSPVASGRSGKV
ncbi:MFS transporter [Kitasatospora sp. GP82]|uniref:MFS transporter n=1 Tax=Kitasatospora sp. GP82 TaxID=3035089 RepID=UPI0024735B99|nr:MFS transporter [Kitasatospora sp. GP82]MDH6125758.1 MFS family permease [Kitasatospora sp. GP82]